MVVSHAFPGFHQPRGRRGNRRLLAVGVSLAAHLLAGYAIVQFGYIAMTDQAPTPTAQDRPIQTLVFRLPKITPPEPSKPDQARQTLPVRQPAPTPYDQPSQLDVFADPQPRPQDPGPLALPTTPPALPGDGVGTGAGGGGASLTPPPRPPVVIRSPAWLRQPNAAQMQAAYPYRAMEAGMSGSATLNCAVLASGAVNDCRVTAQSPPGEGFGPAAVQLSRFFVMTPLMEDGVPVTTARVVIPISFRTGG